MADELSDEELMRSYQQGDFKAFETLYGRYSGRVYGYLKKRLRGPEIIDDLHQAIFLKLHEVRSHYNADFKFAPWLFVITKTTMLDYLRKQKKATEKHLEYEMGTVGLSQQTESPSIANTANGLSEKETALLQMRYGEDLDFEAIAKSIGVKPVNVRQQISRVVRKLRKLVGQNEK
jgi:RNA polymerase sigma factor (sigma-70 family)